MKTWSDLYEWREFRKQATAHADAAPGFVPTMGALHPGHLSLVQRSVAENDITVVSIFVNPAQFDQASDLVNYPVTLESDLAMLADAGVDHVILPDRDAIYPDDYRFRVTESDLSGRFCGAHRPGHFDGVLTVVLKLFQLVRPERAYFGLKDFQQLTLIGDMIDALFLDVTLIPCEILREDDGLAMSSRNRRLTTEQRKIAPRLYQLLTEIADKQSVIEALGREGFDVDYVEDFRQRRLAAVRLGNIRLIDNIAISDIRADLSSTPDRAVTIP